MNNQELEQASIEIRDRVHQKMYGSVMSNLGLMHGILMTFNPDMLIECEKMEEHLFATDPYFAVCDDSGDDCCSACSGTGEGQIDGSTCSSCKGSGIEPFSSISYDEDFDIPDEKFHPENYQGDY